MSGWLLVLFAVMGAVAGVLQARSLAQSARVRPHKQPNPLAMLLRLSLVAVVLVLAARAGQLPGAAMGWLTGFVAASALLHRRLR